MPRIIEEDTPRWVRWTLLGVALVVLTIVGAFVWLLDPFSSHEAALPASPASTATSAATSSSTCGLPDGDQAVPTKAPQASWDQVGNLLLPSSPALGPGHANGTARTCFAHSPAGAVMAALNASASDASKPNPSGLQFAGFQIIDSTSDRVTLELAYRLTQGSHAGALLSTNGVMAWRSGDWKLVGGADSMTALADLAGFVSFGPGGA